MSVLIKGSIMPLMREECPCCDCDDYSCKATGRGMVKAFLDVISCEPTIIEAEVSE